MRVIGIDPGVAATGYAVVERAGGTLRAVALGASITNRELTLGRRLALLRSELLDLITLHHPEAAAIEKLFFNANVRTAMAVGQASGVAVMTLAEAGVQTFEYTPGQVKQSVVGVGSASKPQVKTMVASLLGLSGPLASADAADACALAICHIHCSRLGDAVARATAGT